MVVLADRTRLPKDTKAQRQKKLETLRKPFANVMTKEMAEKHAFRLQRRIDLQHAEKLRAYQTEYNNIAGRASHGGASADHIAAVAMRNFTQTHGARHLPK